jgi:hypothetical protein
MGGHDYTVEFRIFSKTLDRSIRNHGQIKHEYEADKPILSRCTPGLQSAASPYQVGNSSAIPSHLRGRGVPSTAYSLEIHPCSFPQIETMLTGPTVRGAWKAFVSSAFVPLPPGTLLNN